MTSTLVKEMSPPLRSSLRWVVVGLVSGWLGVVGFPTPQVARLPLSTQAAIAQSDITNQEITQYATAVLQIDEYRNDAYTQIKDILLSVDMSINEINVSCSDPQNISSVPRSVRREVRQILTDYCNQSQEAVEAAGLSARRFNEITEAHAEDPNVFERIQQELIRLQQDR